jgi:hypothetical protein
MEGGGKARASGLMLTSANIIQCSLLLLRYRAVPVRVVLLYININSYMAGFI